MTATWLASLVPFACGDRVIEVIEDADPVLTVGTVVAVAWSCDRPVVTVRYDAHLDWPEITVRYDGNELMLLAGVT